MKTPCIIPTVLLLFILSMSASAASISMTASDASGASSLNQAGKWSNAQVPSAANDYFSSTFFIRTPADGNNYTFAGNSLTLQTPSGQAAPMRSIIFKGAGNPVLTINNLTNSGGIINFGSGSGPVPTFTGNLMTVAASSTIQADQGSCIIGYPIVGSSSVILTNTSGQSRTITYTGNLSGFAGKFNINSSCTVALNSGSSNLGNPASSTPDQITIGAGCTLLDNAGLTFGNANGGITLFGPGNVTISAASTTIISEPITDLTNGVSSVSSLTSSGGGVLTLSSAANNYSGGTTISGGTLRMGIANGLPQNGNVTDNGVLDLNGFNTTVGGLTGTGSVDTQVGGTPTLTVGFGGTSSSFSGMIQNSAGTLNLTKTGAGTLTLAGGYTYSGSTLVAGGTLSLLTSASLPVTPGDLVVSNAAILTVDASSATPLPANNVIIATNSSLSLVLSSGANGINAAGSLTFQDNATNAFTYGTVAGNPTAPAINVAGGISAPGSNIVINIAATGLQPGTFTLIKYTGTALASIAQFQVNPPPGVAATLVNNTGNDSIDLTITSIPNQLAWNGVNGTSWDLSTANWTNTVAGGITVFRQYTNGSVIAGDAVTFDDTLTNDFVNPQPTNINLTARFFAFPVIMNSTLPYSIAGAGGIVGVTSLVKSNTGSLTLLTSNSFSGGVKLTGGSLIITNDSALGASSGGLTLSGGTLQINGGITNSRAVSLPAASTVGVAANVNASLGGTISGAGASLDKTDNGTLILTARETFTGDLFIHGGTVIIDSGGSITNGSYHDVGQNGTDAATLTMRGTGSLLTTSDFNVGDLDSSVGTLNVSNTATLTMNAFYIGSANASGSTASGTVNQSGGTITEISTGVGTFAIGGRTSTSGVGVYNMSGGTLTANAGIRVGGTGIGTLNQSGGQINALGGINIARIAGSFGTNNLNGGTLSTFNVTSGTGTNAVFNFNGGKLQAAFNPPTPWMSGLQQANILAGGAVIDSSNFNVTISQPLLAGSAGGGLTKLGSGTLALTGVNTFTGPITNTAGTLALNSVSTYAGAVVVNGGTVSVGAGSTFAGAVKINNGGTFTMTTTPTFTGAGGTTVSNGAIFSITQLGSATSSISNLTLSGGAAVPGATVALGITAANNSAVPVVNCGTLTLSGTNSFSLGGAVKVGTTPVIKYVGPVAGSGTLTNLLLPQGATGYISNDVANSTLAVVVTSVGPGIVWAGTNSSPALTNLWDINSTVNWLLGSTATKYQQTLVPGDPVTFNDVGSGTVLLSNSVGPASITISNTAKTYTFSGNGGIVGPTGLLKLGTGTAILNLTNNSYAGDTVISNGTLQVGNSGTGSSLSPAANVVVGPGGTLQLSAQLANVTTTVREFSGAGVVNYTGGNNSILAFGGNTGGTWNGTIHDNNGGGLALTKAGNGTWVVGGSNYLNNGDAFNAVSQNQFNGGAAVITNGGLLSISTTEFWIAQGAGSTSTVVVAGGTLAVTNNWLIVGRGDATANGTLVVNSGTVQKAGNNNLVIGFTGTGTLTVNGGQVLNNGALWLGQNAGANGTLHLNGGLVQASQVLPSGTPASSTAYFNGGTLQATANSADFINAGTTPLIQSGGLILDDGGFAVSLSSQSLQEDPSSTGGGLIKKGAGTLYLDSASSYTGTTVVTNGTLAGAGSIASPVVVAPAGNLGAGDAGAIGTLTVTGDLTVQGAASLRISKTGGTPTSDRVTGVATANYGGTLVISNATTDATPLVVGDTFTLFSATTHNGNFSSIVGSPGTGLSYSFANGVLSVVSAIASNPTNITFTSGGGNLTLSWPSDHKGWTLQTQTNTRAVGLRTNWVNVGGSSATNQVTVPISLGSEAVFYRLVYP